MSGTVELEASHKRRLIRDIGPGRHINEGSGVTEVLLSGVGRKDEDATAI